MKAKILIADDEENIRYTLSTFLQDAGYQVEAVSSLSKCITTMQQGSFDLLFLDITLGRDNGIEAISGLKVLQPDCSIVIITGNLCPSTNSRARKYGALDCLVKPVRQQSLLYIVQKILKQKTATDPEPETLPLQQLML